MKALFWGTPVFALPALRALTEEGHQVVGVVTQPDRPAGRGRELARSPVKEAALAEGIPVLQPERARGDAFMDEVRGLEPEISVVVAYGQILRPEVLALPPLGSINIHASLLPALRGAAPIQWAIMRGEGTTGVTLMRMEAGLDSGPILLQTEEEIRPDESASELASRLSELGATALIETLALMQAEMLREQPQDHALATYAPKLDRETARLDWAKPAPEISRWIRGLDDVPGGWTPRAGGAAVKLFRASAEPWPPGEAPGTVVEAGDQGILVSAGQGAVRVLEVQPSGKRRMSAAEWARGRGVSVGERFG